MTTPRPGPRERFLVGARRFALPVRDRLRRLGWLGPLDGLLARWSRRLVPPLAAEIVTTVAGGARLRVPAGIASGRELARDRFEPEVTEAIAEHLHPGGTFVDVGASIGYHTVVGATLVGEAGHVYAFEPDPDVFTWLTSNIRDNGFSQVVATQAAVAAEKGTAVLRRAPLEFSSIVLDLPTKSTAEVEVVSLDGFFADLGWPRVDVVKLDIEGAEHLALAGMRSLVERNPHLRLVIEWNPVAISGAGLEPADLARALVDVGFVNGRVLERRRAIDLRRELPPAGALYNLLVAADA